ncbi:MAG TPA: cob(I)yrinic acid a,c-diamide adenosyltransferase [Bacteroidales bacterium]|nr:cob(I)yrinic acid a,c-diamide adenosyltransferase [Bacteroidales bacterium]
MKIYTRTGDDGTTSLAGGQRVPKNNERIEAYGTIDEIVSWVGLLRSLPVNSERSIILYSIQDKLMHSAAILSAGPDADLSKMVTPDDEDIRMLEDEIDKMEKQLPQLNSFILPGGTEAVSFTQICRTVCRRAERQVISLQDKKEHDIMVVRYLNRLSDYLFVLARKTAYESGIEQSKWIP